MVRRDDLVSLLVDETIEAARADGSAPVWSDPIVARRHGHAPVATHCAAEAARESAHRERECERFLGAGSVVERTAITCELRFQDGFAGRRQFDRTILRLRVGLNATMTSIATVRRRTRLSQVAIVSVTQSAQYIGGNVTLFPKAGHPVRCGLSVKHRRLWNAGSPAFAGDDS
jgi:hypothetical protein